MCIHQCLTAAVQKPLAKKHKRGKALDREIEMLEGMQRAAEDLALLEEMERILDDDEDPVHLLETPEGIQVPRCLFRTKTIDSRLYDYAPTENTGNRELSRCHCEIVAPEQPSDALLTSPKRTSVKRFNLSFKAQPEPQPHCTANDASSPRNAAIQCVEHELQQAERKALVHHHQEIEAVVLASMEDDTVFTENRPQQQAVDDKEVEEPLPLYLTFMTRQKAKVRAQKTYIDH